jgi:hypothetical protein
VTGEPVVEEESVEPAAPAVAERPYLVFVPDPAAKESDADKIEKQVFQDERVALGSRAFTCVRMTPDDADADPLVSKHGKDLPRVVLVTADYKAALALSKARISTGSVWDSMKTVSDKWFTRSLEATVREMREIVLEADKIAAEKKALAEKRQRLDDKASPAERAEIEKKVAALDERQRAVNEKEATLWALTPKSSAGKTPSEKVARD